MIPFPMHDMSELRFYHEILSHILGYSSPNTATTVPELTLDTHSEQETQETGRRFQESNSGHPDGTLKILGLVDVFGQSLFPDAFANFIDFHW